MYKMISLLLIAACSSFAVAQHRGPGPIRGPEPIRGRDDHGRDERGREERERRDLVESTRRLARMTLDSVDLNADRLNHDQLRRINNLLVDISMALSTSPSLPPPPPYQPPQPLPPPVQRVLVTGAIENTVFNFNVSSLLELHEQCTGFVQAARLQNVDDISVSVNFGATQALRNQSSYWTGTNKICSQIIQVVQRTGVGLTQSYNRVLIGSIEAVDFKFVGADIMSLSNQCTEFVIRNRITNVDEIILSVDFGREVAIRNQPSYWSNSFDICQQILQNVR